MNPSNLFKTVRAEIEAITPLLRTVEAVEKISPAQSQELLRRLERAGCAAQELNNRVLGYPPARVGEVRPEVEDVDFSSESKKQKGNP